MSLRSLFTEHPATVGETYSQHLWVAARFSALLFLTSIACLIHAIIPAWFKSAGSDMVGKLNRELSSRHSNDV